MKVDTAEGTVHLGSDPEGTNLAAFWVWGCPGYVSGSAPRG